MKNAFFLLTALAALACNAPAGGDKAPQPAKAEKAETKAPEAPAMPTPPADAKVFFTWPDEGSKVPTTFDMAFGVDKLTVTPAGQGMGDGSKGHHHVIVDGKALDTGTVVPANETNIHYGKGQTEAQLTLKPGKHTLTLQFADAAHRVYGPALSQTINIEVVELPAAPKVSFVEPADGAKVTSPFKVGFGLEGLTVRPAMEDAKDKTSGHHHIVVDGQPVPLGQVVPTDDTHIHFGKGQTEAELTLPAGKHTLTLQLADGAHRSYGAALSATITVEVEGAAAPPE
ncbi:MAG: DUF4399 domain-containing protein [Myxococcales bacterium]|nr:DUF4399 domain-containing protein [Myxococcales bacterium]